jgi:hypothetical protein
MSDSDWAVNDFKIVDRPTLGLYMDSVNTNPDLSTILLNNDLWYVRTMDISKGENYAGKINRSL